MSTPFKLRVDWTAAQAYPGAPVEVELLRLHDNGQRESVKTLRTFAVADTDLDAAVQLAVAWAIRWFDGRGLTYWHQARWHQAEGHTYVTLHYAGRVQCTAQTRPGEPR